MSEKMQTGVCRFCGQTAQLNTEEKLTKPQAEEMATMQCNCSEAVEYQKRKAAERKGDEKRLRVIW